MVRVTQGYWQCHHLMNCIWLLFTFHRNYVYLLPFSRVLLKVAKPSYPMCIWHSRWMRYTWNFIKSFGVSHLESLGNHAASFAWWRCLGILIKHQLVRNGRADGHSIYHTSITLRWKHTPPETVFAFDAHFHCQSLNNFIAKVRKPLHASCILKII